ncbi:MAG: hypothetical protein N3E48_01505 [Candidatus Bathyarchaeota archaeon]|nr:hypothetical protein [Candidatus Bathyarchaeota archaeon]
MGKFVKVERDRYRWRITIPKELQPIIGNDDFVYIESVYGFLALIPLNLPTFNQLIKKIEDVKTRFNWEKGEKGNNTTLIR